MNMSDTVGITGQYFDFRLSSIYKRIEERDGGESLSYSDINLLKKKLDHIVLERTIGRTVNQV